MNQDILRQATQTLDPSSDQLHISKLAKYAKNNCKKCYSRGYRKMVKMEAGKWVLDRYDICKCVFKSKQFPELVQEVQENAKKQKLLADLEELNLKMDENATLAEIEEAAERIKEANANAQEVDAEIFAEVEAVAEAEVVEAVE